MKSSELRSAYLDFFSARAHKVCPSTPIIPQGDASLMFNSAGMVPFKPYFLGLKTDLKRAASAQKCFRTTDIDRVGHTLRHMTFFEMLGNFSFGDYFKEESIAWAWEFLTKNAGLDPRRLHPSVFKDDEEAFGLWKKLGVPHAPVRLGEKDNFWNMGPTGPCGPCSEIYFDRGPEHSCGQPSCAVGCDCDRFLEVWNLVFTQFDRQADGSLKNLPRKNIDTGMGLERLAFVAQGTASPFETDAFLPIFTKAAQLIGVDPKRSPETGLAYRVICDHVRAATMLLSEGVIPSNVERGYVLRRLIRRAARYGQLLGREQSFLHELVPAAIGIFSGVYPDLKESAAQVAGTLKIEEEKFLETLKAGERELETLLKAGSGTLSGEAAFKLYDTFGFPLELTKEICLKRNVSVDEAGFKAASAKAVGIAKASWKGSGEKSHIMDSLIQGIETEPRFYDSLEEKAVVLASQFGSPEGDCLVLDKSPFYPEGGGQVGDEGTLLTFDGKQILASVIDTQRQGTAIVLTIKLNPGCRIEVGDRVLARVDAVRRGYIAPHHTGTHLLNEALRRILGGHVRQAGSYVGADKLRFDYTHPKGLDPETLKKVEAMVAAEISARLAVETKVGTMDKARELGATTLLGEDYGEKPRMVLIGPKGFSAPSERFSLELCGGTHVANTADLKAFRILKESSVAAGVRRIEALAGKAVEDYDRLKTAEGGKILEQLVSRERELLAEVSALGGKMDELPESQRDLETLRKREKELWELIQRLKTKKLAAASDSGGTIREVGRVKLYAQILDGADPKNLRSLADRKKAELGAGSLVFLAAPQNGKLSFVLASAAPEADASKLAKTLAAAHAGSAGGRADFAQGGMGPAELPALVEALASMLK